MKALKIIIAIIALTGIVVLLILSRGSIEKKPEEISESKNQFTKRIEQKIDSLSKFPNNKFCQEEYVNIEHFINTFYKPAPPRHPFGRLGETKIENDEMKKKFMKELFSVYTKKFTNQAFNVFSSSEWDSDDLKFIREESVKLIESPFLERSSEEDIKLTEIQTVLSKYDEIDSFIASCKNYSLSASDALSNPLQVSTIKDKITKASAYINSGLDNNYVKNCIRLNDELMKISRITLKDSPVLEATKQETKQEIKQETKQATTLSVSNSSLTFTSSGGSQRINVTTNSGEFSIKNCPAWCSLKKYSDYFILTCQENRINLMRNYEITVVAGDKTINISISQTGKNDN